MVYTYSASTSSNSTSICRLVSQIIHDPEVEKMLCQEQLMDLRLVLSELMINASEHGNQNCPNKRVYVDLAIDEERIRLRVRDEGHGFPSKQVQRMDPDKCSGRGLMIVRALCDSIQVEKSTIVCQMRRRAS